MENNVEISIIVPIYNVEKYLRNCLDSIKAQTFKDFEVVIVDDGSPDSSAQIAQEYADGDSRFRIIHQENGGVGSARNTGIKNARGKYIAFVDGDDAIREFHLEKLIESARSCDADIVCCGYGLIKEDTDKVRESVVMKKEGVYTGYPIKRCALRDISLRCYLWSKLWKKSLFTDNAISFPNRYFEDSTVIPTLFYYAKTISVIKARSYLYTVRNNSITGLTSERCVVDYLSANREIRQFYHSKSDYKKFRLSIAYLKAKVGMVAFCWVFVRIWRAKTFKYAGRNLSLIIKHWFTGYKDKHKSNAE